MKSISQHYLHYGFTGVRFGLHNDRGIFGACPGEMLHLISLGWFKYCLDAFSAQAGGPQSIGLKQYDRLCAIIGQRLTRQSDRDLPGTNFPKGFASGANLMGHEIAGCLLVKLFALHTTAFQDLFPARKKAAQKKHDDDTSSDEELPPLSDDKHVSDWIQVVSSPTVAPVDEAINYCQISSTEIPFRCAVADASCCCCFPTCKWNGYQHHQDPLGPSSL